jgi:hypothetical protein
VVYAWLLEEYGISLQNRISNNSEAPVGTGALGADWRGALKKYGAGTYWSLELLSL